MTKTKIIVLIALLILLSPSYINLSCLEGYCAQETEVCTCGFLPLEFFVTFVWAYVIAAFLVEFALLVRKIIKKK